MLLKVEIDNETFRKIQQLIDDGKYQNLYQFVTIAIRNQIHEEFVTPDSNIILSPTAEKRIPLGEATKLFSETKSMPEQILDPNLRRLLENTIPSTSEVEVQYDDLIWSFYNRFLPVKIVIYQLATMVAGHGSWVELTDLQSLSYESALKISENLREYEEQHDLSRNQKLSTGLPTPLNELNGVKRIKERRKIEDKINSSRKRFMEQFVGKRIHLEDDVDKFKGACFDMGMMSVKFLGDTTLVNLTQTGKEFALLKNPILDEKRKDISFSNDEVEFILKKIIPKFKLEKSVVDRILDEVKRRPIKAEDATRIYKEEKGKYLKLASKQEIPFLNDKLDKQQRIATMGRLSELGLVKWEIDEKGFSIYSNVKS